ncbi:unnamed protein product [Brugia pahangi]|uniref:Secreted RxLR effector peptide protein n=1 Tax=Brugia pahangi TaxID=6280 RepID=A0A0N4T4T3_BRUPA|nr:unnamed protein product [Brugia pahangi]
MTYQMLYWWMTFVILQFCFTILLADNRISSSSPVSIPDGTSPHDDNKSTVKSVTSSTREKLLRYEKDGLVAKAIHSNAIALSNPERLLSYEKVNLPVKVIYI